MSKQYPQGKIIEEIFFTGDVSLFKEECHCSANVHFNLIASNGEKEKALVLGLDELTINSIMEMIRRDVRENPTFYFD